MRSIATSMSNGAFSGDTCLGDAVSDGGSCLAMNRFPLPADANLQSPHAAEGSITGDTETTIARGIDWVDSYWPVLYRVLYPSFVDRSMAGMWQSGDTGSGALV